MKRIILTCIFSSILIFTSVCAASETLYTVQIASFKTVKQAEDLLDRLSQKDIKAYVIKSDLGTKGTWFRVRYGKFSSKSVAASYCDDLKARGIDSFVAVFTNTGFVKGTVSQISEPVVDDSWDTVHESLEEDYTVIQPSPRTESDGNDESDTKNATVKADEEQNDENKSPDTPAFLENDDSHEETVKNPEFENALQFANKKFENAFKENDPAKFKEALNAYRNILTDYIDEDGLYRVEYMIAECYVNLGQYDEAIKLLKDLVKETKPDIAASMQYEVGYIYYHYKKEYYEAVKELSTVTVDYPDTVWAKEAQNLIDTIMQYKIFKE